MIGQIVGVRVHVDEAWRDDQACRIDDLHAPRRARRFPTATMRPSLIATSARRPGAPDPSITRPPTIAVSYARLVLACRRGDGQQRRAARRRCDAWDDRIRAFMSRSLELGTAAPLLRATGHEAHGQPDDHHDDDTRADCARGTRCRCVAGCKREGRRRSRCRRAGRRTRRAVRAAEAAAPARRRRAASRRRTSRSG